MCGGCGGPAGNISENGVAGWSLLDKRRRDGWLDFGSFFLSFLSFLSLPFPASLIELFLPFSLSFPLRTQSSSSSFLPSLTRTSIFSTTLLILPSISFLRRITLHHSLLPPPPSLIPGKSRGSCPLDLPPLSLGSFRTLWSNSILVRCLLCR